MCFSSSRDKFAPNCRSTLRVPASDLGLVSRKQLARNGCMFSSCEHKVCPLLELTCSIKPETLVPYIKYIEM